MGPRLKLSLKKRSIKVKKQTGTPASVTFGGDANVTFDGDSDVTMGYE